MLKEGKKERAYQISISKISYSYVTHTVQQYSTAYCILILCDSYDCRYSTVCIIRMAAISYRTVRTVKEELYVCMHHMDFKYDNSKCPRNLSCNAYSIGARVLRSTAMRFLLAMLGLTQSSSGQACGHLVLEK